MISVILPIYNEEKVIPALLARLKSASRKWGEYEVVFVDDGSVDNTFRMLKNEAVINKNIKVLSFSRNFGHQTAVSAGLKHSKGELVAVMDSDLQDPPELISEMVEKHKEGFDIIYAVRKTRQENFLKRAFYKIYYRLLSKVADIKIPLDAGDFSLMDRKVVDVINNMPEHNRFIRGLRSWTGFKAIGIQYDRAERADGVPKYTIRKLMKLAFDGITSFSTVPLKISVYIGFIVAMLSFLAGLALIVLRLTAGVEVAGWTSLILAVFFMGGIQLFIMGVMGEYIGRIYTEVQNRPLYIIKETINF